VILKEIPRVRQHAGETRRRWFCCDSTDLYVWENEEGGLRSFELCYDKPNNEHSLRYLPDVGFNHARIDDGETSPLKNEAPIMVSDGAFDLAEIALKFEAVAGGIDPPVYRFVLEKLHGIVSNTDVSPARGPKSPPDTCPTPRRTQALA
jgi:hypothetical protein